MAFRAMREYKMVVPSGSVFTWAATNHSHMMLSSDITIPASMGSSAITYNYPNSPSSGTASFSFIFPEVYDIVSVFDGTAYGTVTVTVNMPSINTTNSIQITSCTINLVAVDQDGNERDLIPLTTIYSTSFGLAGSGAETMTKTFMWWQQINSVDIQINERMRLDYTMPWVAAGSLSPRSGTIVLQNGEDGDQTTISLPVVIS
ncbi:hypothetical protein [Methanolobus psychrotolerans]|uniref:hypothetical protein n=1 Tax=Methanolobus psychrotolerans TaxID=1874706 RepID=UPI000B91C4F5|nr:hypothetical protein [Methanolobus psychrotolerans]